MPQSLANLLVHIVFSTKDRRPFLQHAQFRDQMHRYLAGVSAKPNSPAIVVGGATDHVHLLGRQSRVIAVADWIKELKRASSIWAKTDGQKHHSFQWQAGYGAFSVQSITDRGGASLYRVAGRPPSADVVSGGVARFVGETRNRIRRAVRLGLTSNTAGSEGGSPRRAALRNPFGVERWRWPGDPG